MGGRAGVRGGRVVGKESGAVVVLRCVIMNSPSSLSFAVFGVAMGVKEEDDEDGPVVRVKGEEERSVRILRLCVWSKLRPSDNC